MKKIFNQNNKTPLRMAVEGGDKEIVEKLFRESGCDENVFVQALIIAAENGRKEIVAMLINRYPYLLNLGSSFFHDVLLIVAAKNNHIDVVSLLVDKSKNLDKALKASFLNRCDETGGTAFIYAAQKGYIEISNILIAAEVEMGVIDRCGYTALHYACKCGHKDIVLAIVAKCKELDDTVKNDFLNKTNEKGMTALHLAAKKGNNEIVSILVNAGVNVDLVDEDGRTAFFYVYKYTNSEQARAKYGNTEYAYTEIVNILFNNGVKLNLKYGLIHAVVFGYAKIVRELLKDKENLYLKDKNGDTLLIIAAKKGHSEVVSVLINKCEELDNLRKEDFLNQIDSTGKAAFNYAAQKGDIEVSNILIKAGAKVDVEDENQIKPFNLTNGYIANLILRRLNGR